MEATTRRSNRRMGMVEMNGSKLDGCGGRVDAPHCERRVVDGASIANENWWKR